VEINDLAKTLEKLGCPTEKSYAMALQLDRKAQMDAERMGTSYKAAITKLIGLMTKGGVATHIPQG
jgi:hypothetical protein